MRIPPSSRRRGKLSLAPRRRLERQGVRGRPAIHSLSPLAAAAPPEDGRQAGAWERIMDALAGCFPNSLSSPSARIFRFARRGQISLINSPRLISLVRPSTARNRVRSKANFVSRFKLI
ncbi:hypothetical protein [Bradyrhizobium sp.]|uniref:hypothetical protein n=1 Tax=Bradyrhizobium sp. TaxID=376 RepID=UPI003BB11BAA